MTTQSQQWSELLKKRQDEAIAEWCLCVRISSLGELVITERRPWTNCLDRRADGVLSEREMVPEYEPIKQYEVIDEAFNESLS